jgi:hypothetical protein
VSREPLLLLPNLGAEERGDWRQTLQQPRIAAAARLWRLLFPASARVADRAPGLATTSWPEAFSAGRDLPAFDWLEGLSGCVPWLANQSSRAEAATLGLTVAGPGADVVEHVHDKAFALRTAEQSGLVPRCLRGTSRIFEPEELTDPLQVVAAIEDCMAGWPAWTGRRFTLKPRQGTSGRGRVERLEDVGAAVSRLAERGGAILEPWLERVRDLSVQLRITAEGEVFLLATLELLVQPGGGYRGHRGEVDSSGRVFSGLREDESLREAGALVAQAAAQAGFHGAAALDGFRFAIPSREPGESEEEGGEREEERGEREEQNEEQRGARQELRPVVELNARFSMGTVVTGLVRRALPAVRRTLSLEPGDRMAFAFLLDAPRGGWDSARGRIDSAHFFVPLWSSGESIHPGLLFTNPSLPDEPIASLP